MDLKLEGLMGEALEGEVHVGGYGAVVCIYGDSTGLRSLAKKLFLLAELNQDELSKTQLPEGEGFHIHLECNSSVSSCSQRLDIGRLDGKGTGDTTWYLPPGND